MEKKMNVKTIVVNNDKIENISKKVDSIVEIKTTGWIYQQYKKNKLFFDRERLQRLLKKWEKPQSDSYKTTLFNGANYKDSIQLAEIDTIVSNLKIQISEENDGFEKDFLKENLDYFQDLQDKGFEYIVLDGQHRIEDIKDYFDNLLSFNPTTPIIFKFKDSPGTIDIKGKYEELPKEAREHLFNSIGLIVVIYQTGDLSELARIFITSNSMKAMTHHEKRILNYNPINRWLNKLCLKYTNIRHMFANIGAGMSGDYDLDSKGDTLFAAEMLCWINDNYYELSEDRLDQVLNTYKSAKELKERLKKTYISKKDKAITQNIIKTMANGCARIDPKILKKFGKASYYNLFMTLSFFMQETNLWGKEKKINGSYKVKDSQTFVKWFFDEEMARLNSKGTYQIHRMFGKIKRQVHDYSFNKHNGDSKHKAKKSMKGKGGSKYSFDSYARIRYLLEDFFNDREDLLKIGAISEIGSRQSPHKRDEFLVQKGIKLSESNGLHLDEIVPISKGGNRTFKNTRFVDKQTNINDGNSTKPFSLLKTQKPIRR
jgi:hypothetical protein